MDGHGTKGLCKRCQTRKALAIRRRKRKGMPAVLRIFSDRQHDLCPQCYRQMRDGLLAQQLREEEDE